MKKLTAAIILTTLASGAAAQNEYQRSVRPDTSVINHSDGGQSYRVGNSIHHPDGSSSEVQGSGIYHDDGSYTSSHGNTVEHSNGGNSIRVGDTWFNSDGSYSTDSDGVVDDYR